MHSGQAFRSTHLPGALRNSGRLYFPGWQAYLDGQKQSVRAAPESGYLSLDVPEGSHSIVLRYEGTAIQHAGNGLACQHWCSWQPSVCSGARLKPEASVA